MRYYIQRTSHELEVAQKLIECGYIPIGWCTLDRKVFEVSRNDVKFNDYVRDYGYIGRNRWDLYRFLNIKCGDIVIVPGYKVASIYEVINAPQTIDDIIDNIYNEQKDWFVSKKIELVNGKLFYTDDRQVDLGFVVKVKLIKKDQPRMYADAPLIARMKIRSANADVTDLKNSIEEFKVSTGPISLREKIIRETKESLKRIINNNVSPDVLERLIKWYFEKRGADNVWIPPKNGDKIDKSDADVIADYNDLGLKFYVQCKKHCGETNDWAVEQIDLYKDNLEENQDVTCIPWVVSTAENYNEKAILRARESGIRLIALDELVEMLLSVGIDTIDDCIT